MGQPGCATGIARLRVIFTGEEQAAATYDPCAFKPGDTLLSGDLMPGIPDALFEDQKGTVISIEVTAGAKTELFPAGYNEWRNAVGCRVTAPASEGRANKAVIALVAKRLDVPASAVSIVAGMTASQKKIHISGWSKSSLAKRLQSMLYDRSYE